jgi:hypothetical protein
LNTNTVRAVVGVGVIVVAIVLLIVLNGNDGSGGETDGGKTRKVVVDDDGHPVGGIKQLTYDQGEQIVFEVEAPFGEEVHLHGYDVAKEIPKGGGTVKYDLPASIEGIFEAELEERGEQIVELTVNPS